jgi:RNA polymerase sigma factor (sigma-70 family)
MGAVPAGQPTTSDTRWQDLEGRDRHAACLVAARDGDRAAFDALVAELSPLVWHVARRWGLDLSSAEDVVQSVWMALLRHIDRLADPRALAGWLITATRREALHVWKSIRTPELLTAEVAEGLVDSQPSPEHAALANERDALLREAFSRLPNRDQRLLRSIIVERSNYRDVAQELGVSQTSIGPLRSRALNRLRRLYAAVSDRPNVAFLPAAEVIRLGATKVALKLWCLPNDRLALRVFNSQDELVRALGDQQPWIAVETAKLNEIMSSTPATVVFWDSTPDGSLAGAGDVRMPPEPRTQTVIAKVSGATSSGGRRGPKERQHLLPNTRVAFVEGELSPNAASRATKHATNCPSCTAELLATQEEIKQTDGDRVSGRRAALSGPAARAS